MKRRTAKRISDEMETNPRKFTRDTLPDAARLIVLAQQATNDALCDRACLEAIALLVTCIEYDA